MEALQAMEGQSVGGDLAELFGDGAGAGRNPFAANPGGDRPVAAATGGGRGGRGGKKKKKGGRVTPPKPR